MAFSDPSESNFPEMPDGQYLMQCQRIEEAEPGQFGARMKWAFLVWDAATQEQICWDSGDPFEWFVYSGTSTGKKSTARKYLQALLNREITTEDTGEVLAIEAIGKTAMATLVEVEGNNGGTYTNVASMKPYVKGAAKGKAKAAAPVEEPEPVAVGAGAPVEDDDDSAPF